MEFCLAVKLHLMRPPPTECKQIGLKYSIFPKYLWIISTETAKQQLGIYLAAPFQGPFQNLH